MLTEVELQQIARARLDDAQILFDAGRLDGSIYVCGYSIELGLKAKICATPWWSGFPSTVGEFDTVIDNFKKVRTHNFESLLKLSGHDLLIKTNYMSHWSVVTVWTPESRYRPVAAVSRADARQMITSSATILQALGIP
jgi:hypothetical protein